MSNYSNNNDFKDILNRLLANVDDSFDKRQGSIIYDALAPAAAELAQCYIALDVYTNQTYLLNAVGENLDNRVADYGLTRNQATHAQKTINVYDSNNTLMAVPIGTRFSVPNEYGGYVFKVIEEIETGRYTAECETAGTVGNDYSSYLLPLTSINNLGQVIIMSTSKPGEDTETDDELRKRALQKINQAAFGGNKADYIEKVNSIDGVTNCKIFPVWNGGGTVKVAIITSNNTIPSASFVNEVQTIIDPITNQGEGIGIAPIGHTVTVVAPTALNVNIAATLTLATGITVSQVESAVENAIATYINEVQSNWSDDDNLIIYHSKLIAAILSVNQVKNVSSLTINEASTDLIINITASNVKFPILGEVVLSAS